MAASFSCCGVRGQAGEPPTSTASLLCGAFALFVWFQRFWLLGVFGFGGGSYWVNRAAKTPTDKEARECLRVVLSATEYGGKRR